MTKYEQFYKALYQYHNKDTIITSRQIDDICKSIGLKAKATFANYKKQCIINDILSHTSKKNVYRINGKSLAYIIQYGNHHNKVTDMNVIIGRISHHRGKVFHTYNDLRNFIYSDIVDTTSMVTATTVTRQLLSSGYIRSYYNRYDEIEYVIGNNTSTPMNHNHNNEEKREGILDKIKSYTTDLPRWVVAVRLWKEGIFVSITSASRRIKEIFPDIRKFPNTPRHRCHTSEYHIFNTSCVA